MVPVELGQGVQVRAANAVIEVIGPEPKRTFRRSVGRQQETTRTDPVVAVVE